MPSDCSKWSKETGTIFDIYENNAYDIQQELKHKYPDLDLVVLIGSVRNSRKINSVLQNTDRILSIMQLHISMYR